MTMWLQYREIQIRSSLTKRTISEISGLLLFTKFYAKTSAKTVYHIFVLPVCCIGTDFICRQNRAGRELFKT